MSATIVWDHIRRQSSLLLVAITLAELLAKIFVFNLLACGASVAKVDSGTCWTDVAHVSRHWREGAPSTHRLWSYMSSSDLKRHASPARKLQFCDYT